MSIVDGRVDGRGIGEMTGEMKGEMKMAKSFYLKGSSPSDGRDGPLFVNTPSLSVNNASLFLRQIFPAWEIFIPTLGTKHSQLGNKTFPPWEYRSCH